MQIDARTELMVIMMEECGELIQACSKALRKDDFYDNQQLIEEVGDVYTMIEIMHDFDMISWNDIEDRVKEKRIKLSKWSSLIEEWEVERYSV
jgi:NTP pyrophosphatase (non-canonical NTP hydrolase)